MKFGTALRTAIGSLIDSLLLGQAGQLSVALAIT